MVFHFICKIRFLTWLAKPHMIRPQAHLRPLPHHSRESCHSTLPFLLFLWPLTLSCLWAFALALSPAWLLFIQIYAWRLLIIESSVQGPPPPFSAYPVSCCPLLQPSHSLALYPVSFSWRHNHYLNLVIGLLGYCLSCPNRMEAS